MPAAPAQESQTEQIQTQEQPEIARPRRSRRIAGRKTSREAAAEEQTGEGTVERRSRTKAADKARPKSDSRRRRAAPSAPVDVEQTASVPLHPREIRFVSGADEAHRTVVADLAGVVAPDLTVRTMNGHGMPLGDVLSLPGADVTVTSSLTLGRGAAFADKIVYLTKLFPEELHALAGPGIARPEDLAGKPVYLGPPESDSEAAARSFLQARGITVAPAPGTLASAIAGVREGRIAAAFILAAKPFAPLAELGAADGLHLLPLPYQTSDTAFYPAALSGADYPALVPDGERIETVALDAILIAPRWKDNTARQQELAAFATRLFERLAASSEGRPPKWREINLAPGVEGFSRLKAAQQWVAARLNRRDASASRRDERIGAAQ